VVAVGEAADALLPLLRDKAARLKVGRGDHQDVEMGPVISAAHRARILALVDRGVEQGATLLLDGRGLEVPGQENGFFVGPTLFDRVTPEMDIYREEIFGPVLIVLRAESYAEAVRLINANPYGNGTAIFTRSGHWASRFQHEIEVGMVGVNVAIPVPMAFFSFGGWKASLFGDLHMHGMEGVYFYTRTKVVTTRWPAPAERTASSLAMPTLG
jgi:malonate-semialdehyde dehydrogenase (acetylating)/methylmalonate-semialdehyde dehydrogenase